MESGGTKASRYRFAILTYRTVMDCGHRACLDDASDFFWELDMPHQKATHILSTAIFTNCSY